MRESDNIQGVALSCPDYLGYIFYPKSKRFVGENPDPNIFTQVDSAIMKAGVFVNETEADVIRICKTFGLEIAQLHGSESPEYCKHVQAKNLTVSKAFSIDNTFDFSKLKAYQDAVDYFLFDTKGKLPGGTGLKFNWDILANYELDVPFFLSGGIGPADLEAVLDYNHPALYGIDINSGFEIEPALKNTTQVSSFIQKIRNKIND